MKKQRKNQKRRILGACLFTPLLMAASVCYMCEAESHEEQVKAAQQDLAAKEEDVKEKTKGNAEFSERLSQLKGQLKDAEEVVEKCEAAVEQAKKDLEESNNKYDEEIAKARARVEKANEDLKEAKDNYALLEKQVKELENQNQNPEEAGQVEENGAQQGSKVDSVSIDNNTPKVGDTIKAIVSPANAEVSYQWYRTTNNNNIRIPGATSASYTVVAADSGSMLSCQVVDAEGNIVESLATAAVSANPTEASLTLVDKNGFQSDGTAVVGDTLSVNIPTEFGNIDYIQWYLDGAIVQSASLNINDADAGLPYITTTPGEVYATVTNKSGETLTSGFVKVVAVQEKAVIKSVTLSNYVNNYDVDTNTNKYIVTVVMDKAYDGTFTIAKANDKTYGAEVIANFGHVVNDGTNPTAARNTYNNPSDGVVYATYASVNRDDPTDMACLSIGADGSATYKFVAGFRTPAALTGSAGNLAGSDATLTRGKPYIALFDQTAIQGDEVGTGNENKSETFTAPYLNAPSSLKFTQTANSTNTKVMLTDEAGANMTWLDIAAANNAITTKFYEADNKDNAEKKNYATVIGGANNGEIDAGTPNDAGYTYLSAEATLKAGIFGEKSTKITSETSNKAQNAASSIKITESKTNASTAIVEFSNLLCDGTVYVVKADTTDGTTGTAASAIHSIVSNATASTAAAYAWGTTWLVNGEYEASAKVTKGQKSVEVENALSLITGVNTGDVYIAVFVPEDEANYGVVYTGENAAGAAGAYDDKDFYTLVERIPSRFEIENGAWTEATAGTKSTAQVITVYDQFDQDMTDYINGTAGNSLGINVGATAWNTDWATDIDGKLIGAKTYTLANVPNDVAPTCTGMTVQIGGATAAAADKGVVKITAATGLAKGEKWYCKVAEGQYLVVTGTGDENKGTITITSTSPV